MSQQTPFFDTIKRCYIVFTIILGLADLFSFYVSINHVKMRAVAWHEVAGKLIPLKPLYGEENAWISAEQYLFQIVNFKEAFHSVYYCCFFTTTFLQYLICYVGIWYVYSLFFKSQQKWDFTTKKIDKLKLLFAIPLLNSILNIIRNTFLDKYIREKYDLSQVTIFSRLYEIPSLIAFQSSSIFILAMFIFWILSFILKEQENKNSMM
jgi:hypothetical protein